MLSEIKIVTKTREVLRVTAERVRDPQLVIEIFRDVSVKSWMEVQETGEMLNTLRKLSLGKETTEQERQEAIEQAKDLARTVPAFGIFMLPGGALLLPLVAKVVPWRLLPSSFDSSDPSAIEQTVEQVTEVKISEEDWVSAPSSDKGEDARMRSGNREQQKGKSS